MTRDEWDNGQGVSFFKKIGITPGMSVLEFGVWEGNFTIPLAETVGETGMVYAVDKQPDAIASTKARATERHLANLSYLATDGAIELMLCADILDAFLASDVLHYFSRGQRPEFYRYAKKLIKPGGLFIVNPTHTAGKNPKMFFAEEHITDDDVVNEIATNGFSLKQQFDATVPHRDAMKTENWYVFTHA